MNLRNLLLESGPWPMIVDPVEIAEQLNPTWRGCRVFFTRNAVKRIWRSENRVPDGAAERLVADIERCILDQGGSTEHVERVLLACMSSYVEL